jgi:2-polyprenyl-3-methyl-5-hydroxy-6-metoxy-1,4-benzoquinol methylase
MIGSTNVCLATYVPLGESKQPFATDPDPARDIKNAFVLGGRAFPGPEHFRRTTMAIKQAMEAIDFRGKDVIQVGCSDGVFCFHAESRGAARVVAVNRQVRKVVSRLKTILGSHLELIEHGIYGVEQAMRERFDFVLCFKWLQMTRHPLLLIRTLSG